MPSSFCICNCRVGLDFGVFAVGLFYFFFFIFIFIYLFIFYFHDIGRNSQSTLMFGYTYFSYFLSVQYSLVGMVYNAAFVTYLN